MVCTCKYKSCLDCVKSSFDCFSNFFSKAYVSVSCEDWQCNNFKCCPEVCNCCIFSKNTQYDGTITKAESDKPVSSLPPEAGGKSSKSAVDSANTSEELKVTRCPSTCDGLDVNKYAEWVDNIFLNKGGTEGNFRYPLGWNCWDSEILSTRLKNAFLKNLTAHDPAHKADYERWLEKWEETFSNDKVGWVESRPIGNLKIEFEARKKPSGSMNDSWEDEDFIYFKWKFTRLSQEI